MGAHVYIDNEKDRSYLSINGFSTVGATAAISAVSCCDAPSRGQS